MGDHRRTTSAQTCDPPDGTADDAGVDTARADGDVATGQRRTPMADPPGPTLDPSLPDGVSVRGRTQRRRWRGHSD